MISANAELLNSISYFSNNYKALNAVSIITSLKCEKIEGDVTINKEN